MTTIKLKNGSGAPTSGDLAQGEPALDLTNKRLYTEDSGGTVIEVGTNPGVDVTFADNRKAIFGTGSDLQIYHDGSNSFITDGGTGDLKIRSNKIRMEAPDSQNMVIVTEDAGVQAFYNGTERLAVTNTGIDVTGTATMDGLTVSSTGATTATIEAGGGGDAVLDLKASEASGGESIIRFSDSVSGVGFITYAQNDGGSDFMRFGTASTERMRIDSAGSTIIKSGNKLILNRTDNAIGGEMSYVAGTGFIFNDANGDGVSFNQGVANKVRIDSAGRVGVGTTEFTDSYKMIIEGSDQETADLTDAGTHGATLFLRATGENAGSGGAVAFGTTFGNKRPFAAIKGYILDGTANSAGSLSFSTRSVTSATALTERMRLHNDGRLSIGIFVPTAKLDVKSDGQYNPAANFRNDGNATGWARADWLNDQASGSGIIYRDQAGTFAFRNDNSTGTAMETTIIAGNTTAGSIVFRKDSTAGGEAGRFDTSGNLLVGKTAAGSNNVGVELRPQGYIFGTGDGINPLRLNRQTSDGIIADFQKDGTTVGSIGTSGGLLVIGDSDCGIAFEDGSTNHIYPWNVSGGAANNDAISLGANGAAFKDLYLSGGINLGGPSEINASIAYLRSSSTNTSSLTLRKAISSADAVDYVQCRNDANTLKLVIEGSGDIKNTNNSYGAISDEKLKENIVDATSQWDDIKAVRVRKYSLKEDGLDAPNMLGVVAQELESAGMNGLVSESVDRNENNANLGTVTKSVNYSILYMKAVKALQEAMVRIESLEAEVSALKGD